MPRPPRPKLSDGIHHIISRGNDGLRTFGASTDYEYFLKLLEEAKARFSFLLHTYCLMPDHLHLLVEATGTSLSVVMHWLLTCYTKHYNKITGRRGHLFQSRFDDRPCGDMTYFAQLLRYISLNPVRKQLCAAPGDWPWSGHGELVGALPPRIVDVAATLSYLHKDADAARKIYSLLTAADAACASAIGPGPGWDSRPPRHLARAKRPASSLSETAAAISARTGMSLPALRGPGKTRALADARRQFMREAASHGIRPRDIARFLDCAPSLVSRALQGLAWDQMANL